MSADGRLVEAASLTVAEASLTGESEAVTKDVAPLADPAGLGDRVNMVFSGTAVTRGPRSGRRDGDGHGHRDRKRRQVARSHRGGADTAPARGRADRAHDRAGGRRDRRRGGGHDPAHRRHRGRLRPRRGDARRRVAGGRGRAGGVARDPLGGARPRRAAHGAPTGDREEAVVGRDLGIGVGRVLRQDRHPHQERDDDREDRHAIRRGGRHRIRLPAGR